MGADRASTVREPASVGRARALTGTDCAKQRRERQERREGRERVQVEGGAAGERAGAGDGWNLLLLLLPLQFHAKKSEIGRAHV